MTPFVNESSAQSFGLSSSQFVHENLSYILKGKKILLGITGSIAAFKACDVIRILRACGAEVRVVLSQGGENFVTRTTLETLSGSPVMSEFWPKDGSNQHGTHHIDTARWADVILVAPATAHFLAKTANGFADDLLTTEILAFQGPLMIAPAMNPAMYSHPAVQENRGKLEKRGALFLGPTEGLTSCGEEGLGRLLEPLQIVQGVARVFHAPSLNQHLLITLGPTRTPLDPVRYLTNRSSGKMGAALCWAALQRGYRVTALCGPMDFSILPEGIEIHSTPTAKEMFETASEIWPTADVLVATAAVLDWDIASPSSSKLKKEAGIPKLEFEKNPDILAALSKNRIKGRKQFVVGFAAETEDPVQNAFKKLKEKNCDALFANDVSATSKGFESSLNEGWWLTRADQGIDQVTIVPLCSKAELARQIISKVIAQSVSGVEA